LSAFAGRLAGRADDGELDDVVAVGAGGAVMVIGGVVVVGAVGATAIGDGRMVAARVACALLILPTKADGLATVWAAFDVAGIVEPMTRTVDVGTTAFDAALAASRAACVCMAAREWTAIW